MRTFYEIDRLHHARSESVWRKLWKLGWGLGFVALMTLLSEWGPHIEFSKAAPDAQTATNSASYHAVK